MPTIMRPPSLTHLLRPEMSYALLMKSVSRNRITFYKLHSSKLRVLSDTLFNLGKAEGSIDAGQMIKPALARGLQLVGATTRRPFSPFHSIELARLNNVYRSRGI